MISFVFDFDTDNFSIDYIWCCYFYNLDLISFTHLCIAWFDLHPGTITASVRLMRDFDPHIEL
jgi:hypothetical protein